MLRTTKTHGRRRLGFAIAATVALLALLGSACQPVQSFWQAPWNPTGSLDLVEGGSDQVRVAGWATQLAPEADLAQQRSTQIVVLVAGQWAQGAVPASNPRPDVEAVLMTNKWFEAYRQPNMGYGFDFTKPAPKGEVTVCVVALNQFMDSAPLFDGWRPPEHVLLGCRTVTVT